MKAPAPTVFLLLLLLVLGSGQWAISATTVAELEAEVVSLRQQLAADADPALYPQLIAKLFELAEAQYYDLADRASQSGDESALAELEELEESFYDHLRVVVLEVIEEWIAASPKDPEPYLAHLDAVASEFANREIAVDRLIEALPDRVEGYRERATLLRYRGEEAKASAVLERFQAAHPNDPDAYKALVDHHRATGNDAAAAVLEQEWLERFPEDPGVLLARLESAREAEDHETMKQVARQMLDSGLSAENQYLACSALGSTAPEMAIDCLTELMSRPLDPWLEGEVRSTLAAHLTGTGDYERLEAIVTSDLRPEEAEAAWMSFLAIQAMEGDCAAAERLSLESTGRSAEGAWGLLSAATALMSCGEIDQARSIAIDLLQNEKPEYLYSLSFELREILSESDIAEILLERITADPGNTHLHQALQYQYAETGPDAKVIAQLLTWLDLDPVSPIPAAELASLFADQGRFAEAIRWQEEAVRRDPEDPELEESLFQILLRGDEEGWAGELAEQLTASDSTEEELLGWRLLAELAREQGNLEDARHHYETYIGRSSVTDRFTIDDDYAETLRDLGDTDEVVRYLERRHEEYSANGWWQTRDARLAEALERLDLPALALPYRRQVLAIAPDNPGNQVALGELLAKLGRAEATEHFGRAAALAPEDTHIIDSVTRYLAESGRYEEALAQSSRLADNGQPSPAVRLTRARALRGLDKFEEAVAALEELLADHPDEHEARLELAAIFKELDSAGKARHQYQEFLDRTASYVDESGDCNCYCDLVSQRSQIETLLATEPMQESVPE